MPKILKNRCAKATCSDSMFSLTNDAVNPVMVVPILAPRVKGYICSSRIAPIPTRGVKVDELATFDIEYLFLNIRGKSVGEQVEVLITCPDDGETKVPAVIDLDEIEIQVNEEHSRDIKLDDKLTLRMRYPSMKEFIQNNFAVTDISVDDTFDIVTSCIEQIYNEEESWSAKDCTKKELKEFAEQLSSKQFKEVERFFETMPKLSHTITVTNPNTGKDNEIVLEGLASFFG